MNSTRLVPILIALAALVVAGGCASSGQPRNNYEAYVRAVESQSAQLNLAYAQLSDADACNGDATCVVAAKGFAAMALAGAGSGRNAIQAPQREPTFVENAAALLGAASPIVGIVAGHFNAKVQSDASIRQTEALWAGVGGIVAAPYGAITSALERNTGDTYNVGGNLGDTSSTVTNTTTTTNTETNYTDSFNTDRRSYTDSFNDNSDNSDNSNNSDNRQWDVVFPPVPEPVDPGPVDPGPVDPVDPDRCAPIPQNPQSNWPAPCGPGVSGWPVCTPVRVPDGC